MKDTYQSLVDAVESNGDTSQKHNFFRVSDEKFITGVIRGASASQYSSLISQGYVEGEASLDQWYDPATGTVHEKSPNPARLVGMTLYDIPIPSRLVVASQDYLIDSQEPVELEFDTPGPHQVMIIYNAKYFDKRIEIP